MMTKWSAWKSLLDEKKELMEENEELQKQIEQLKNIENIIKSREPEKP
jgi:cell division septum initiation protein DivIVA